jgi:hypothetical protein
VRIIKRAAFLFSPPVTGLLVYLCSNVEAWNHFELPMQNSVPDLGSTIQTEFVAMRNVVANGVHSAVLTAVLMAVCGIVGVNCQLDMYTVTGASVSQVNGFYVRHQQQKEGMEVICLSPSVFAFVRSNSANIVHNNVFCCVL